MKTLAQIFEEYSELPEFIGMELHSVNQPGRFGDSMLQVAIIRRDLEEVECLLAAGADPNWRGQYGYTPLHNAVMWDLPEIVERLLKAGAKVDVANDDGRKPIDYARSSRVRQMLEAAMRKADQ
jgi:ankyrin repeat protein